MFCAATPCMAKETAGHVILPTINMKKKATGSVKPKRRRAVVTPQLRREAITMIKAGKPSAIVAKQVKVSVATVHNIKKAAGLTKPRAARATKRARKK